MVRLRSPLRLFQNDDAFLHGIDRSERVLAKFLTLVLGILTVVAAVQIGVDALRQAADLRSPLVGGRLTLTLGHLLDILIALEVLQNITSYLRRGVVQIELVLATAITAVARKVIVLPPGSENKPMLLLSLGVTALCLAAAWWLVNNALLNQKRARTEPARSFREQDRWLQADDAAAERSTARRHE